MSNVLNKVKNKMMWFLVIPAIIIANIIFHAGFVYNEAGHMTHIRTLMGTEKVATETGYAWKGFGRATAWKQAQTIQFTEHSTENVDDSISVNGFRVVFLGNVDGTVEASTRFRVPQGEQFLKIAREYRTPENFYLTAVVPAVKETLQSTASLMTADDYFAGARSEFGAEFQNQLIEGQYIIQRREITVRNQRQRQDNPSAVTGTGLPQDEETSRSQFEVVKVKDKNGSFIRKAQTFRDLGVDVVEARITNINPNELYRGRMVKVQTALADLAVARQDRLKEEENKLLVIARGEKQVEEKRQETLRVQVEQTTNAQTSKQLAVIEAEKARESARIQEETQQLLLNAAEIESKRIKTLADANAYEKRVLLEADGALAQKLATLENINHRWADAFSKAPVPHMSMGGGSGANGRSGESMSFMDIMTANAAKQLSVDMKIK